MRKSIPSLILRTNANKRRENLKTPIPNVNQPEINARKMFIDENLFQKDDKSQSVGI